MIPRWPWVVVVAASCAVAIAWVISATYFYGQLIHPLRTLSNVVAALREQNYALRARGGHRVKAMGDLVHEINTLSNVLQKQNTEARDALTLLELVVDAMPSPVLAFDATGSLRLINAAAKRTFHLELSDLDGKKDKERKLRSLFFTEDQGYYGSTDLGTQPAGPQTRWSVRRTVFRMQGVPHTLFVLTDVEAALREEERLAWQRLIRVLSHEINNSLTPIKSIAGSLRISVRQTTPGGPAMNEELRRGMTVIEERAASLNRFIQAYQQLTRLPNPTLQHRELRPLLEQVILLETRLRPALRPGPEAVVYVDSDQLQQLLINLIRNAVNAALASTIDGSPQVAVSWSLTPTEVVLQIRDNGLGLANSDNLFVPFYTTKQDGCGIGLILAQQIATAHKGSIRLYNVPDGHGCIAEVRLGRYGSASLDCSREHPNHDLT